MGNIICILILDNNLVTVQITERQK